MAHYNTATTFRGDMALAAGEPAAGGALDGLPGQPEHWAAMLGGAILAGYGISRMSLGGLFLAGVGVGISYAGAQSAGLLEADGLRRMALGAPGSREKIEIEGSVTVDRPVGEVYSFWRDLPNLARFMKYIESVELLDDRHSRWTARVPKADWTLQWEAEVVDERSGELIAWRSLEGSEVINEGHVTFAQAPGGRGTEIHARIRYRPPAGALGARLLEFLDALPQQLLKEDLRRCKHILETGEVPTIEGQTSGREDDRNEKQSARGQQ